MLDRQTELFLARVRLTMNAQGGDIAAAMQAVLDRDAELAGFILAEQHEGTEESFQFRYPRRDWLAEQLAPIIQTRMNDKTGGE